MKLIIQAVVVAALFTGTQAKAEDAPIVVPSQWTYADRSTAPMGAPVSAFAGSIEEMIVLEPKATYADRFVTEPTRQASGAADPALSQ